MALLQNSSLLQATLDPMGTTEATLRMENVDVKDEWQDEDLPRYSSPGLCVAVEGWAQHFSTVGCRRTAS